VKLHKPRKYDKAALGLKAPWRPDSKQLTHHQAQIPGYRGKQVTLLNFFDATTESPGCEALLADRDRAKSMPH